MSVHLPRLNRPIVPSVNIPLIFFKVAGTLTGAPVFASPIERVSGPLELFPELESWCRYVRRATEDAKVRVAIGTRLGVCRAMARAERRRNMVFCLGRSREERDGGGVSCAWWWTFGRSNDSLGSLMPEATTRLNRRPREKKFPQLASSRTTSFHSKSSTWWAALKSSSLTSRYTRFMSHYSKMSETQLSYANNFWKGTQNMNMHFWMPQPSYP